MGPFFPNSTLAGSPLDVSVYGPLKKHLAKALVSFKSLSYKNIGAWIEPALNKSFTKKNILSGFSNTGIWDQELDGPNINFVSSQYANLIYD